MPDETQPASEQSAEQSPEAAIRADHITREAIDVFGDYTRATEWLQTPLDRLSDHAPLAIAVGSDEGMQQVFLLLRQMR